MPGVHRVRVLPAQDELPAATPALPGLDPLERPPRRVLAVAGQRALDSGDEGVPAGQQGQRFADGETAILLFEPTGTANTGGEVSDRTREPVDA